MRDLKKILIFISVLLIGAFAGCGEEGTKLPEENAGTYVTETPVITATETPEPTREVYVKYSLIKVDETKTYQEWESFGGSGCWWSQYVGTWDEKNDFSEVTPRDDIATLLFDKVSGIGLNCYRYNIGAGSADTGKGNYSDVHRRTESFEVSKGVYDWDKDAGAVWFMTKADELMGDDSNVILFCNSPIERLTKNGTAQSTANTDTNISEENYAEFAAYCFDVAEHFLEQGINVTEISPINEPQWDWTPGNQEGMHLSTENVVKILEAFVTEIKERPALKSVKISGPESGEWGTKTREYINAIMQSEILKNYFDAIDCHSYWTTTETKTSFANWMKLNYPDLKLHMSEWCEMVNGSDYTMDSAFNMADCIMDDLKILNVTSWQYWVLVSPGGYRDGLIHVNESAEAYRANRRLWTLGNFSKFIKSGYVRVEVKTPYSDIYNLKSVAFAGANENNEKQAVVVLTNEEDLKTVRANLTTENGYNYYEVYTTTLEKDLELTAAGEYNSDTVIQIEGQSVTTIVFTKKN